MREMVRAQKGPVFRPATWALFFALAAFILGGAVHTKRISHWWHLATVIFGVWFHMKAMWAALSGMSDLHEWLADPGGAEKGDTALTP